MGELIRQYDSTELDYVLVNGPVVIGDHCLQLVARESNDSAIVSRD